MKKINRQIRQFFKSQGFTVVSTVGRDGMPHNACKGIIEISADGKVYLLDLYKQKTYHNLKYNPRMSVTAVDEHGFRGYCLKGKAKLIPREKLSPRDIAAWEAKITGRITGRLIKNIRGERSHPMHPEALLPKPEYMIVMEAGEIVDLTPRHLRPEA